MASVFLVEIQCQLNNIENRHTLYHGKHCIRKFCESLREHVKNIIDFEKETMLPLTKEELKSHQDVICEKRFLKKFANNKNYRKLVDHCHFTGKYRGAGHNICNLRFNVPNGGKTLLLETDSFIVLLK